MDDTTLDLLRRIRNAWLDDIIMLTPRLTELEQRKVKAIFKDIDDKISELKTKVERI